MYASAAWKLSQPYFRLFEYSNMIVIQNLQLDFVLSSRRNLPLSIQMIEGKNVISLKEFTLIASIQSMLLEHQNTSCNSHAPHGRRTSLPFRNNGHTTQNELISICIVI